MVADWLREKSPNRQPPKREVKVVDYQTAMRELMNKPFLGTPKYREQQGRANREGVYRHPQTGEAPILLFEQAYVRECRRRGIPVFAHCVVRTNEEQQALYMAGKSNARAGKGPHPYGMAADIIHGTLAWKLDRKSWEILGHIGNEVAQRLGIEIEWGGDWSFYDPAHWELKNWRELAGIK